MTDLIVDFSQQRNHNNFQHNTMSNLILDFPQQRKPKQWQRVVRFADTAQLRIVKRHGDTTPRHDLWYTKSADTAQLRIVKRHGDTTPRHDLWYTKSEYDLMTLAIKRDVLDVRMQALNGADLKYAGNDDADASPEENIVCCIGIEHLLTPAWMDEAEACRARCRHAVLAEQAKQEQDPSASARLRWEAIALASLAETRKAVLRARNLGKLHWDSSERSC